VFSCGLLSSGLRSVETVQSAPCDQKWPRESLCQFSLSTSLVRPALAVGVVAMRLPDLDWSRTA